MNPWRSIAPGPKVALALSVGVVSQLLGVQTNLPCVADTTLSEYYRSNNLGGLPHVNVGTTQNHTRNRGLFQFDLAGNLPPGSKIRAATLVLEVTLINPEAVPFADYSLHRVLRPWGEGVGASARGEGALATTNEATWQDRFAFTTNQWSLPGAAPTNDYAPVTTATQTIYGPDNSPYSLGPTPQLVADLQLWLDHPETNFGWMLLCDQETTAWTARRFGSREDTTSAPQLEVDYLAPPKIDYAEKVAGQFRLHFLAEADQNYAIQFRSSLGPSDTWSTLTNVSALALPTNVVISDIVSNDQRFYRIATQ